MCGWSCNKFVRMSSKFGGIFNKFVLGFPNKCRGVDVAIVLLIRKDTEKKSTSLIGDDAIEVLSKSQV